jgi:hypothetical protein
MLIFLMLARIIHGEEKLRHCVDRRVSRSAVKSNPGASPNHGSRFNVPGARPAHPEPRRICHKGSRNLFQVRGIFLPIGLHHGLIIQLGEFCKDFIKERVVITGPTFSTMILRRH